MRLVAMILFLTVCPLSVLGQTIYRANDEITARLMERDLEAGSHWYGAYYTDTEGNDHKLGYMSFEYHEILTDENKRLFEVGSNLILNLMFTGNNYETNISAKDLYEAAPPFNLLSQQLNLRAPEFVNSSLSFLSDQKLDLTKITNGKMSILSKKIPVLGLQDLYSQDAWLEENQTKIGDNIISMELFDGEVDYTKYTLIDVKNDVIGGVTYKYFELSSSSDPDKRLPDDLFGYKDQNNWIKFSLDIGENFIIDLRLESKARAIDLSDIADLYILNSIFIDESSLKFIDFFGHDQTSEKNVWYEIIGDSDDLITSDYPSQHIKTLADNRKFLIIGTGLNAFRNSDFEYEKVKSSAYEEAKIFSENNPELVKIVSELVKHAELHQNDWSIEEEIIRSIRSYVSDLIEDEYIYYDVMDPYDLLKTPKGDCTEHTALFNALLKAAGIPAREASGYILADESGQFTGHAWSEVAYDGIWIPVDATWDQWVENSVNYIKTTDNVSLGKKEFKLRLHKVEYDDGHFEFYDNYYK